MKTIVLFLILLFTFFGCKNDESLNDNQNINHTPIIEKPEIIEPDIEPDIEETEVVDPEPTLCEKIDSAWNMITGYPYVWGGSNFSDKGFDCSGAIFWVSKAIGKPFPRTTSLRYYMLIKSDEKHWSEADCGYWIWWTFSPDRPQGHIGWHSTQPNVWQSGSSTGPTMIKMWKGGYWDGIFDASKRVYE